MCNNTFTFVAATSCNKALVEDYTVANTVTAPGRLIGIAEVSICNAALCICREAVEMKGRQGPYQLCGHYTGVCLRRHPPSRCGECALACLRHL